MIRSQFLAGLVSALFIVAASAGSAAELRPVVADNPLPGPVHDRDYYDNGNPDAAKVRLGGQLFFDKVLSGNFNISCASCHHPFAGTGDGLSLPVGEGGRGLGVTRDTGLGHDAITERVPRNAPAIFNLGAREFVTLFHDGRIEPDRNSRNGFASPAGAELPDGLANVLAAQAMFPVTSGTEMAGQPGENPVADAAAAGDLAGPDGVWAQLAERLQGIDSYVHQFIRVFPDVNSAEDIRFTHAANAIAAYEARAFRSDNSPFDRFLRGERGALSLNQHLGMRVFYSASKANCASCHRGSFQTNHGFRSIAIPPVGPGKGDGDRGHDDFGRERVSGIAADRYRFRVPSLRNVALTAPYGHNGAFDTLEGMLRHHLDSVSSLYGYDPSQLVLPRRDDLDGKDLLALGDDQVLADIAAASELPSVKLSDSEVGLLLDFLHALTDPAMLDMRGSVPESVPSGLPLGD
jgi:cytochrome c peroxidase